MAAHAVFPALSAQENLEAFSELHIEVTVVIGLRLSSIRTGDVEASILSQRLQTVF